MPTACYVNYTLYDNCAAVGETKAGPCGHGGKCYDEDVLPLLEQNLASYESGYRFVVLHFGGGSHGPLYKDRHPPEFRKFEPMCTDADVAEQVHARAALQLVRQHHPVRRSRGRQRDPHARCGATCHTSSSIYPITANRCSRTACMFHGMPPGMALPAEQAQIPLIVKSSVPASIVPRAEYGQPDVFDSVLDLFTIQAAGFDRAGSFLEEGRFPN